MLLIAAWGYASVICFLLGAWTRTLAGERKPPIYFHDAPALIFRGLVVVVAVVQAWGFVAPINIVPWATLLIVGVAVIPRLEFNRIRFAPAIIIAVAGGAIAIRYASLPLIDPDSHIYHVQAVKWWGAKPVVVGLANLNHRLGFVSATHGVTALLNAPFANPHYGALSSWLLFMLAWLAASTFAKFGSASPRSWYALLVAITVFYFLRMDANSPSPDISIAVLGAAGMVLWLSSGEGFTTLSLWMVAVTMKLAALPLMVGAGMIFSRLSGTLRWRAVLLCAVLFVPWMARNVLVSGYAVYPVSQTALNVDWRVPARMVATERALVDEHMGSAVASLASGNSSLLLLMLCALSVAAMAWEIRQFEVLALTATCAAGVGLLLATGPHLRFGLPYLAPFAFVWILSLPFTQRALRHGLTVICAAAAAFVWMRPRYYEDPPPLEHAVASPTMIGSMPAFRAKVWCFDDPLPCVNSNDPLPRQRSNGGFAPN